jgi:ABC-type dipeptide/oligopeptide/nickel transport system permease component
MCTISIISNINYLLSGKFYYYFHKKVFRVTEYRFWYSIIGCSSEYPVNRVLVAIPKKYAWYLNCSLSSQFTSMVVSQKSSCSKHHIIGLGYYASLVYQFSKISNQWDHIWDITTSLTSPLVLKCFYQARKVTGHVVLVLEVLLILPLSTILLIWIDELQIITESRIVQWQNSIYIAVARIKGLA